jgi:hypothetical protein
VEDGISEVEYKVYIIEKSDKFAEKRMKKCEICKNSVTPLNIKFVNVNIEGEEVQVEGIGMIVNKIITEKF